jgi:8-oxo-dGTP pyrophosphatase MutT (NUDIX family)
MRGRGNLNLTARHNIRDQALENKTQASCDSILRMKHVEVAGGVVLNVDGKVAVVKNRDEFWSLPKGHIEEGEDALTAARREIQEETGLTQLVEVRELGSYQRHRGRVGGGDDPTEFRNIRMFLFTTEEEKLEPQDDYNPVAEWVLPEDVENKLTHPRDKEFFVSIKDSLK